MRHVKWWLPIIAMAILAPFTPYIDLSVSDYFYRQGEGHFASNKFYDFLYDYGPLPANIVAVVALILFLLSFAFIALKKWRAVCLMLVATLVTGGWLISHELLKDHWGRPRPKQIVQFGGAQEFRPFYSPNFFHQPEPSKSFPCGHCLSGFFFFTVALIGMRMGNRYLIVGGVVLALLLGISLSWMRIALGGHFVSDTLMSALIIWLTALFFDWLIYEKNKHLENL